MNKLINALPIVFIALFCGFILGGASASGQRTGRAGRPHLVPQARNLHSGQLEKVPQFRVPGIDREVVAAEDARRERQGLPARYAIPNQVRITPETHGSFEVMDNDQLLWRLRVYAPGASSINLGFKQYFMPEGGQLMIYSKDGRHAHRPFTHADNKLHGQLWTPVILSDEMVVEVTIPRALFPDLELELTHIGYGYRGFGASPGSAESGSCNVDVACPSGDPWRDEISAVGAVSLWGFLSCSGFMVNNTSNDRTPYFMMSLECLFDFTSAPTLVVYWNYETSVCGGTPDGALGQFNTGSIFRSADYLSDFALVQLDTSPDPSFGVTFAGWDRTGTDASGAVVIHHPSVEEKRISFENDPTTTTSFFNDFVPGDGTHIRVADWDLGTTEFGSEGAPLFNPDHRVIGQYHSGYASCSFNDADWFGKFSVAWTGGGTPDTRLSDWLDAAGTGALTVDTLGTSMWISPSSPVLHQGCLGGPFSNSLVTYTLSNQTTAPINYQVSLTGGTGILIDGGTSPITGMLAAGGGSIQVIATLDVAVDNFATGRYVEQIIFDDLTNGASTTIDHAIEIGRAVVYSFPLDSDPGWTREGQWVFGTPTGAGGLFGLPDPTSGFTGSSVLGYNLTGDYMNDLPETHLTSSAIDCTGLSGVTVEFKRWLNVEQPLYDHASFRVSNDGVNFVTLWENGSEITDSSWSHQQFDISTVADNQPTVYLRWTMGTTDFTWTYSGWNIDDIRITAIEAGTSRITQIIDTAGDGSHYMLHGERMVVDASENVYITTGMNSATFKITDPGGANTISLIADYSGDGLGNGFFGADAIAVDSTGNVFLAGKYSDNVFMITDPGGANIVSEIMDRESAGPGFGQDSPHGITVDSSGNVYVASTLGKIFKITDPGASNTITQISLGGGAIPFIGGRSIEVDPSGNLYVTGNRTDNVFMVSDPWLPTERIIQIIGAAGDGSGNPLRDPRDIALDGAGTVYVTGFGSHNVFKITDPGGANTITEIMDGTGDGSGSGLENPIGIAVDAGGQVLVVGSVSQNAFKIEDPGLPGQTITEIINQSGDGAGLPLLGDGRDVASGVSGNVYVSSRGNAFKILPSDLQCDGEGDGLTDEFEAGFGGDGIKITNPETGNTATASGSAAAGATIDSGSFTVELPPGTSVSGGVGATLDLTFVPDPDRPKVVISGADLAGQTKSVVMPIGTSTVVCIDDRPNAVIELLDAGGCPPPPALPACPTGKISIPLPAIVGASTTVNTMTPSPECAPATYTITRLTTTSVRIDGLVHSAVGLRPANEIFLVIGNGPGNAPFFDDQHLFQTQLDLVEDSHVVRMGAVPEFVLPGTGSTLTGPSLFGSPGSGPGPNWKTDAPAWIWDGVFTVQIMLWNPQVFPQQPEQYSQPIYVRVLQDGSLWIQPYGSGTGIGLWAETGTNAAGQPVVRFPFTVPGL